MKLLKNHLFLLGKWLLICLLVGILAGLSSALFLYTLEEVTNFRDQHLWILFFLPFAGFLIGLLYHFYGKEVLKGTNLILEEYQNPQKKIPLKMTPLVYIGTLLTHLFGGSAGREGTAVQMSSAIADQFTVLFKLSPQERKIIIITGISAGFASVFGTPLTGAVFAIELLIFSSVSYKSILPSFLTAYIAYFTVEILPIQHTHYIHPNVPEFQFQIFPWLLLAGICFGLTARLFATSVHLIAQKTNQLIKFPPLRPFLGGLLFVTVIYFTEGYSYLGLGIPTIVESFNTAQLGNVFIYKILATALILGTGFKGGEVTPLFFIGATLGSALSVFIPLPVSLLAAMGFVAVFSGATHTPIACILMGMELFGIECGLYISLACIIAYFSSGYIGIYQSQIVKGPKHALYNFLTHPNLKNL
ncbi:chloride channel protein [Flavobacterium sp.]|uniref:chloride channel protein n=1 Tax=Flavobacterium sp. TaxID=239 RepID=UPI0026111769|nr:chloride channel protein [Flavobacterium sp.]